MGANLTLVDLLTGVEVVDVPDPEVVLGSAAVGAVGVGAGSSGVSVGTLGDDIGVEKGVAAGDDGGVLASVVSTGNVSGLAAGGVVTNAGLVAVVVGVGPGSDWVTGVNFLKNCLFLSVTLPLPSILTLYLL